MGMHMRVRTSARLRMRIPAQIHTYEGARPRALPEGLGFPVEKIEDMSAGEAEEHIAALYGDELYGLELDGEVSGEGAMRCACGRCGPTALPVRKARARANSPVIRPR